MHGQTHIHRTQSDSYSLECTLIFSARSPLKKKNAGLHPLNWLHDPPMGHNPQFGKHTLLWWNALKDKPSHASIFPCNRNQWAKGTVRSCRQPLCYRSTAGMGFRDKELRLWPQSNVLRPDMQGTCWAGGVLLMRVPVSRFSNRVKPYLVGFH